jgi:diguanylate cyclase (GGDEF)-like protein
MSDAELDIALALSARRDLLALAEALVTGLRSQASLDGVQLLTIANANRDSEFNDANIAGAQVQDLVAPGKPARLLEEDEDLVFCVRSGKPVSRDREDGRRLVYPLYGSRHVNGLLVLNGLRSLAIDEVRLTKILQLYSNFAFLLSRNELDPLTGLYNRQSFEERLKKVALASGRSNRRGDGTATPRSCFALVDIDHFKQVNDKYGHLYGDEVLLLLSRLMARTFRHEDMLFRYGGEEFAIALASVDPETALKVLERFRKAVEAYQFPQIGRKTVSVGVAEIGGGDAVNTVVARADAALYYAKNHGRNRVCGYEQLVAGGELKPIEVSGGDIELF